MKSWNKLIENIIPPKYESMSNRSRNDFCFNSNTRWFSKCTESNRSFWDWTPHKPLWYSFVNRYWYFFLLWRGPFNWRRRRKKRKRWWQRTSKWECFYCLLVTSACVTKAVSKLCCPCIYQKSYQMFRYLCSLDLSKWSRCYLVITTNG